MPRRAFNALTEMEEDGPILRPTLKSLAPLLNDSGFFDEAEKKIVQDPTISLGALIARLLPIEQRRMMAELIKRNLHLYLTSETKDIGFVPDLNEVIRKIYYSIPCLRLRFTSGKVGQRKCWQLLTPENLANHLLPVLLLA